MNSVIAKGIKQGIGMMRKTAVIEVSHATKNNMTDGFQSQIFMELRYSKTTWSMGNHSGCAILHSLDF